MKDKFKWGKITLPKDSSYQGNILGIKFQIDYTDSVLSFKLASENEDIEEVITNRIVGKVHELFLLPALPDRTLILKPKNNLSISPNTAFKFYVYLPVNFQLYSGGVKVENKVFEYSDTNLSSTWFGEPSEGELCYALYTSFDTEINKEKMGDKFVICPIEITNSSKEILEVKRLAVCGFHLNIYANNQMLISNKVKINYTGFNTLTNVQYSKVPTSSVSGLKQIASARIPEGNTVIKRSFQLIRHITQF